MRLWRTLVWARAGAVLAVLLVAPPSARGQRSPCPDVFSYTRENDVTVGEIEVSNIGYGTHTLKLDMSIRGRLQTSSKGKIKLLNPNNLLRAIQSSESVFYRVIFPVTSPPPTITSITYDGNTICTGPRETFSAAGELITDISLSHTLRANLKTPVNSPDSPDSPDSPVSPDAECGVTQIQIQKNFIVGGHPTSAGEWPWLVAIYLKTDRQYICTGSLVSTNVVISAAHCMYAKKLRPASAFFVELGAHDRVADENSNVQIRELRKIELTPGHGGYKENTLEDITALVLASPVTYTDFIQPICLWGGNKDLGGIVGNSGNVVGWGSDERGNVATPEPLLVKIPIVSNDQCRQSSKMLSNIDDNTQFCAGTLSPKQGPCSGDSGAGLTLYRDGHYELRGVVSYSLQHESRACDLSNYIVFCDAAKFSSWIQGVITTHKH